MAEKIISVVRQKSLYLDCHSGLDPESNISELDSRFRGNDGFVILEVFEKKTQKTPRGSN